MTAYTAKVTSKGQITLPAELRAEFGVEPGDLVVFFRDLNGRPTFRVRHMTDDRIEPMMKWSGPARSLQDIDRGIGEAAAEEYARSVGMPAKRRKAQR